MTWMSNRLPEDVDIEPVTVSDLSFAYYDYNYVDDDDDLTRFTQTENIQM